MPIRPASVIVLLTSIVAISAHSNLGYPLPYWKRSCKPNFSNCRRKGQQACPPLFRGRGRKYSKPSDPAAVWSRGQKVEIVWHKNNHVGGFYRRSIVPVKHMMDPEWHEKSAFQWGCWSKSVFPCHKSNRPKCGKDKTNTAYKDSMIVPKVIPDGDYIFSQVWYGGLQLEKKHQRHKDNFSCSFIRIAGGPEADFHDKKFSSETSMRNIAKGTCATGSTRPMECGGTGCLRKPIRFAVPEEFQNNRTPAPISRELFEKDKFFRKTNKKSSIGGKKKRGKNNLCIIKRNKKFRKSSISNKRKRSCGKLARKRAKRNWGRQRPRKWKRKRKKKKKMTKRRKFCGKRRC